MGLEKWNEALIRSDCKNGGRRGKAKASQLPQIPDNWDNEAEAKTAPAAEALVTDSWV